MEKSQEDGVKKESENSEDKRDDDPLSLENRQLGYHSIYISPEQSLSEISNVGVNYDADSQPKQNTETENVNGAQKTEILHTDGSNQENLGHLMISSSHFYPESSTVTSERKQKDLYVKFSRHLQSAEEEGSRTRNTSSLLSYNSTNTFSTNTDSRESSYQSTNSMESESLTSVISHTIHEMIPPVLDRDNNIVKMPAFGTEKDDVIFNQNTLNNSHMGHINKSNESKRSSFKKKKAKLKHSEIPQKNSPKTSQNTSEDTIDSDRSKHLAQKNINEKEKDLKEVRFSTKNMPYSENSKSDNQQKVTDGKGNKLKEQNRKPLSEPVKLRKKMNSASNFTLNYRYHKARSRSIDRPKRNSIFDKRKDPRIQLQLQTHLGKNRNTKKGRCETIVQTILAIFNQVSSIEESLFGRQILAIQGHFGSGLVAFFLYILWIFKINLVLSILWVFFIVLPTVVHFDYASVTSDFYFLDIITGEGVFQESWLFYGQYQLSLGEYPLGFFYLFCIMFTYFGSFFITLHSLAQSIEQQGAVLSGHKEHLDLMFLVFTSWDYSLTSKEAVGYLSRGLANSVRELIIESHIHKKEQSLSVADRVDLLTRRALAWLITLVTLSFGCTAIFFALSTDVPYIFGLIGYEISEDGLIAVYGPTLLFIALNGLLPLCCFYLPRFEKYPRGIEEINVTVIRVFLLRVANIVALVVSLVGRITLENFEGCAGNVIGQEIYKLVVIDTFLGSIWIMLPHYFWYYWEMKRQEFDIASQVLKILYRQPLILLGCMVCPIMPVIGVVSMAVFFYTCYYTVMQKCSPPLKLWKQPRQNTLLIGLMSITLLIVIVIFSFILGGNQVQVISRVKEGINTNNVSMTSFCGPFGNHTGSVFEGLISQLSRSNPSAAWVLSLITSKEFAFPSVFVMLALLYYQKLRIKWEQERNTIATVALQTERNVVKELFRKLKKETDDHEHMNL